MCGYEHFDDVCLKVVLCSLCSIASVYDVHPATCAYKLWCVVCGVKVLNSRCRSVAVVRRLVGKFFDAAVQRCELCYS
jgi:hypothetical protein